LKPEQGINFQFQVASMSRTGAFYAAAFDEVDHCDSFAGEMACLNQAPFS
jgi:hypothetical protein